MSSKPSRGVVAAVSAVLLSAVSVVALAQAPAAAQPTPAERAIKYRQALYTVLSGNFGAVGQMAAGRVPFNGPDAAKRATRAAQVAAMLVDAYPDISKTGGTTDAKPEIWTNRAEFDKINKDLADHTAALAALLAKDTTGGDAFKAAANAVANDCKTCHDKFRAD